MAMEIGAATEGLGILMLHPMFVPGSVLGFAVNSGRIAGDNSADYVSAKFRK